MPDLAALIRQALPDDIGLGLPEPAAPWPDEGLPGAVPVRIAEFRQGRSAARAAMRAAGLAAASVPVNPDRSPQWPPGVTGSISHCKGACMALAGRTTAWAGLGIDLEPAIPIEAGLWPTILDAAEIAALPETARGLGALQLFVAKEAAYKAQFAQSGQLIGFHDLSAAWISADTVRLRFARPVPPFAEGREILVRILAMDGIIAGICLLPAGVS